MYKVDWTSAAADQLARLWLGARDRAYVREMTDAFDERLAQFPHLIGESRGGMKRVAFEGTFFFTFEVNRAKRIVTVESIARIRRRL